MHLTSIHGIFLLGEFMQSLSKNVSIHLSNTEERTQIEVVRDQEVEKDVWT